MPTIRTRDNIYVEIPDGMSPDAPEVREAIDAERVGRRRRNFESPEMQAKIEKGRTEDRERYDPTKGMSGTDKVLSNLGAGFDTAMQGLRQITPGMKGPSDEQLREKRGIDERLAAGTDLGIGADWMPSAGTALQFAGETGATALPGGIAANVGRRLLPKALSSTAGRAALTEGTIAGGTMGAAMPTTSEESKLVNAGVGAVGGAALPLALGAGRFVRDFATGRGARLKAAEKLGVTPDTPIPADPVTLKTPGAENVPLSTAATYGDEALAGHELASRGRMSPGWGDLDKAQRRAVWENVEQGTARSGSEPALRAERKSNWDRDTAAAMQAANPKQWQKEVAQLRGALEGALSSPAGQNEMRPVLHEIIRQMDELGKDFGPQHLAALRSRMAGRVRGSPTDPFTSAPMGDPAFISLRKEFDDILSHVTGGKWDAVNAGYRESSIPLAQAKAETMVKGRFMTPEGLPRTSAPEGFPTVTEHPLRGALASLQMKNTRGTAPTFAPDSERVLTGTLDALNRQNILQRAKTTGTGGGGSFTAPLNAAMNRADPSGGVINAARSMLGKFADSRAMHELDQALIDPQRYFALVQEAIAAGQPLSAAQQAVYRAATVGLGSGAPHAMQPDRQQMR